MADKAFAQDRRRARAPTVSRKSSPRSTSSTTPQAHSCLATDGHYSQITVQLLYFDTPTIHAKVSGENRELYGLPEPTVVRLDCDT